MEKSDISEVESEKEAYDSNVTGPISNRGCTDVICCLIFVLFVAGLGVIGGIGFKRGNAQTLIYQTDYLNQVCGISKAVADKPYLFFFDYLKCLEEAKPPTFDCPSSGQVCVEKCPTENYAINVKYYDKLDDATPTGVDWDDFICEYDIDAEDEVINRGSTIQVLLNTKKCANYYTKSEPWFNRCFPSFITSEEWAGNETTPNNQNITKDARDNALEILNFYQRYERFNSTVDDLKKTLPYMIIGITISMFASLIYIILIRWLAAIMVFSSIILVYALLVFATYFCWKERNCIKNNEKDCTSNSFAIAGYDEITSYAKMEQTWYITAIILSVIIGIMTVIITFLINRIQLAILGINEAIRAVSSMLCSLLWAIILFVMQLAFLTYWCFSVVFIASIANSPYQINTTDDNYTAGESCDPTDVYDTTECILVVEDLVPNYVFWFLAYSLVGLFWILNFISALGETTLAGAFAGYYWAFTKPDDIKSLPLFRSFWRCSRYHIGSLAFGSLVIPIIQPILRCIGYVARFACISGVFSKFIYTCCKCCICHFEVLRSMNHNAYIHISVHGESFCTSAKNASNLLIRNITTDVILGGIHWLIFLFGKMLITLGTVYGATVYFGNYWDKSSTDDEIVFIPKLNYFWAPILFMAMAAYVVADSFFGVYEMAIDTLFFCYLEDLEASGDERTAQRPNSDHMLDILESKVKCCSNNISPNTTESNQPNSTALNTISNIDETDTRIDGS
ncbi:choline transporter-like protein 2 [Antedon mediterranea]|uniref:choline transporter-like protein 2 n=1 Tax=Antedon mediterranea TaxID=105859 RepID=UPI003AF41254